MKMKKLITTFALSAVMLSGLSIPTFAADLNNQGKPADAKTKAIQASILKDTTLKGQALSKSPLKFSHSLSTNSLLGASGSVYWTDTQRAVTTTRLNSNGHDLWSRELKEGENNYYWAYSYYYNSDNAHYSTATLNRGAIARDHAVAGKTSAADSDSYQSPFAYKVTAGLE